MRTPEEIFLRSCMIDSLVLGLVSFVAGVGLTLLVQAVAA